MMVVTRKKRKASIDDDEKTEENVRNAEGKKKVFDRKAEKEKIIISGLGLIGGLV